MIRMVHPREGLGSIFADISEQHLEDYAPLLLSVVVILIIGLLVIFRVPLGGCGVSGSREDFGGGRRKSKFA